MAAKRASADRRRARAAVEAPSDEDFNVRIRLNAQGNPMSAMGEYGALGRGRGSVGGGGGEEGGADDDEVTTIDERSGEELYADDINFHHFKQVSPPL